MEVKSFSVAGPMHLIPCKRGDARGFFSEVYNQQTFDSLIGEIRFVQENHSLSTNIGTIRGLHFQTYPRAQGKLVRAVRGAIFDVAVDIRRGSPTYGQYVSAVLSAENWCQLWIPVGFAHGFCTIEANTEVIYKVTDLYSQADDKGLAWDDFELGIEWPIDRASAILSEKDQEHPRFAELPAYFTYSKS
jgi:dTDP-4-dehydrorhamnose 3,5-epimerase